MIKKKNFKGSALVVSLLVLAIILICALSITLVSLRERKASLGATKSSESIQKSSGANEIVKKQIFNGRVEKIKELFNNCPDGTNPCCDKGGTKNIKIGESTVELFEKDGTTKLDCDDGSKRISDIGVLTAETSYKGESRTEVLNNLKSYKTRALLHFDDNDNGGIGNGNADIYDESFGRACSSVPQLDSDTGATGLDKAAKFATGQYVICEEDKTLDGNHPSLGGDMPVEREHDFNFGSEDFTIEAWIKLDQTPGLNVDPVIASVWGNNGDKEFRFYYNNVVGDSDMGKIFFEYYRGASSNNISSSDVSSTIMDGSFHHVAVSREDGYIYIFVDGTKRGDGSIGSGNSIITPSSGKSDLVIGECKKNDGSDPDPADGYQFIGSMDEFRVTKGFARYIDSGTNYTPWTAPYDANF